MAGTAINLKEAISVLESYEWVSLRFITADISKGIGGEVIETAKCRICRNQPIEPQVNKIVDAAITEHEAKIGTARNPNHGLHFTRNIEFPNKGIRKIHPVLITHINQVPIL